MPYLHPAAQELPFHSGSPTSRDAAKRAAAFVGPQGAEVLAFIAERHAFGATQKEIADALQIGRPSVCARVRALETAGKVWKTTERRGHCAVYVAS